MAKLMKVEIKEVCLHGYGFSAKIEELDYVNIYKEFIISIAGVLFQVINIVILHYCIEYNVISMNYYDYLFRINMSIAIVNLLPIIPLDGGRILRSIIHLLFRYKLSERILIIISVFNLIILYKLEYMNNLIGLIFIGLMLINNIIRYMSITNNYMNFLFYRYNNKIRSFIRYNEKEELYRNGVNLINVDNSYMSEEKYLKNIFK